MRGKSASEHIFQGWVVISGFSRGKENPRVSGSSRVSRVCWLPCYTNYDFGYELDNTEVLRGFGVKLKHKPPAWETKHLIFFMSAPRP